MRYTIDVPMKEPIVCLASDIVYCQKQFWCHASCRQMRLSLLRSRCNFPYDSTADHPLVIWLTGGSFCEVDRNVWMPEMTYFAKQGYAVASVEYSTDMKTLFPEQLIDIKAAIRFLRCHAKEFHLQTEHIAVMGESAGGYFSALTALCNHTKQYDEGENLDYPSTVDCAVTFYLPTDATSVKVDPEKQEIPFDARNYPNLPSLVEPNSPPFLLLHGCDDDLVPSRQSLVLYDALEKAGVPADLYLVRGANHADHHFFQEQVKETILAFLKKNIGQPSH